MMKTKKKRSEPYKFSIGPFIQKIRTQRVRIKIARHHSCSTVRQWTNIFVKSCEITDIFLCYIIFYYYYYT